MPLDPNISLGLQPMPQLDLTRIQQLRNLMGQEALMGEQFKQAQLQQQLTQAQIPGVQAQSAIQQRTVDYNRFLAERGKEFLRPDDTIDINRMIRLSAEAGYLPEAQNIAGKDLANTSQLIANTRSEQDRAQAETDYNLKLINHAAGILHASPPDKKVQALSNLAMMTNQLFPKSGDYLQSQFLKADPKTGQVMVDDDKVNAVRTAQISAQNQEEMSFRFAQNFYTKEAQDKNSQLNNNFRSTVNSAAGRDIIKPNDTIFTILNDEVRKNIAIDYMRNAQVPQQVRAAALEQGATIGSQVENYKRAILALDKFGKDYLPTKLGTIGSAKWNKFISQSPELAGLETAIQVHNNALPNDRIEPSNITVAEILSKLRSGQSQLESILEGKKKIAGTSQLPSDQVPRGQVPKEERIKILRGELNAALARKDAAAVRDIQTELKSLGEKTETPAVEAAKPAETKKQTVPYSFVRDQARTRRTTEAAIIDKLKMRDIEVDYTR